MSSKSLRFNPPKEWLGICSYNIHFFGLFQLIQDVKTKFEIEDTNQRGSGPNKHNHIQRPHRRMIEIGSYKGESTLMFAASGLFNEIHCIDPHSGYEEANDIFGDTWDNVHSQFLKNTSQFSDIITHHRDYSYNISDRFEAQSFDFIYVDGSHEYDDVLRDLSMYSSKTNIIIAGHDYQEVNGHPGVAQAVNELFGRPYKIYQDGSWMVFKKRGKYYSL
jgi:hypothetical protein